MKDFFKEKVIPAVTAFVAGWALSGFNPIAGAAAAITTMALGTGEGRQLIDRVGNELFDDVLGMRPKAAHTWSSITLHVAGSMLVNAGLESMINPNKASPGGGLKDAVKKQVKESVKNGNIQHAKDVISRTTKITDKLTVIHQVEQEIATSCLNTGDAIGQGLDVLVDFMGRKAEINYQIQLIQLVADLSKVLPEGTETIIDIYANMNTGDIVFWEWAELMGESIYSPSTIHTETIWIKGTAEKGEYFWTSAY